MREEKARSGLGGRGHVREVKDGILRVTEYIHLRILLAHRGILYTRATLEQLWFELNVELKG